MTQITSNKLNNEKLAKIEEEYNKLAHERGAVIQDIVRIERAEESRFLFEDADFSFETIKKLIAPVHSHGRTTHMLPEYLCSSSLQGNGDHKDKLA